MATNDNAKCDHDWEASLEEAGVEVCAWKGCPATREAPASLESCAISVVAVDLPGERRAA